jgi:putative redox protein
VNVDNRSEFGGDDLGASMELVLMGVAGCSAIDMISILRSSDKRLVLSKLRLKETCQVGEAKSLKIFMLFLSRR